MDYDGNKRIDQLDESPEINDDSIFIVTDNTGKAYKVSRIDLGLAKESDIFSGSWDDLTDKPSTFPPSSHTHTESQITDLDKYTQAQVNTLLSGKENVGVAQGIMDAHELEFDHDLIATALQSGDDISELTNDVGYITDISAFDTGDLSEGSNLYFTEQRVRDTPLNGLSVTGGTINSTDTVIQAFGAIQNQINSLLGGVSYQGVWNATTNSPSLASGVGTKGHYYVVDTAGSTNIDGITDWKLGDWIIFNGTTWQKVDNTDAVISVNGYTGAITLTTDDIGDTATNRFTNDTDITRLANTSGTNTGDVTVSDSAEIDFTLTGQQISASIVNGSIDETKLDASVNASLDLADTALQAESDTLDSVTSRGNTTNNDITVDEVTLNTIHARTSAGGAIKSHSGTAIAEFGQGGGGNWTFEDGVKLNAGTANRVLTTDASKNIAYSSVTDTELGYLSGVTSSIQTQLGNKADINGSNQPFTGDIEIDKTAPKFTLNHDTDQEFWITKDDNDYTVAQQNVYTQAGFGNAGNLAGSTYVATASNLPTASADWTISLWIYQNNTAGNIMNLGPTTGSNSFRLTYAGSGATTIDIYAQGATDSLVAQVTSGWGHSSWRNLIVTYTQSDGLLRFYINNTLVYTPAITGGWTADRILTLGALAGGSTPGSCLVDEVLFYNRVLTSGERALLYASGVPTYRPVNDPANAWSFDQSSGTTVTDYAGAINMTMSSANYSTGIVPTSPSVETIKIWETIRSNAGAIRGETTFGDDNGYTNITGQRIIIDAGGSTNITVTSGLLTISGNTEKQKTASSSTGVILSGGNAFLHDFSHPTGNTQIPQGYNIMLGRDAGNFTMGSTATSVAHGSENTLINRDTGKALTTGYRNTFVGAYSGSNITTGHSNVAVGFQAMTGGSGPTGQSNVAIGNLPLTGLTSGNFNVAIGNQTLRNNTTGQDNVAIGRQAGQLVISGGANTTGQNSIFIGLDTRPSANNETNQVVIGANARGNGSNTITFGDTAITNTYITAGNLNLLNDNAALRLGGGTDASIYYDGTDLVLNPRLVGSGVVNFLQATGTAPADAVNVAAWLDVKVNGTAYKMPLYQ